MSNKESINIFTADTTLVHSEDVELGLVFLSENRKHKSCGRCLMARFDEGTDSAGAAKTIQYTWRGLRMVGESSLFDLEEVTWHPDEKSLNCDKCKTPFTLLNRRHHCRRCGDVMCGNCCEKMPLSRMGYVDPVLVCKDCVPICKKEEEFLSTHLKHLIQGGNFHLSDSAGPSLVYHCKLSSDHKQILISNDHPPIDMKQILEVKTVSDDSEGKKSNSKAFGLEITYKSGGLEQNLTFTTTSHSRKHALEWLKALKRGLIILHN